MSDEGPRVYRASVLVRNRPERRFDRLLSEAAPGELARRGGPSAARLDEPVGTDELGRQALHCARGDLLGETLAREPPPDRLVPVPSRRERLRTTHRVASVVDQPGGREPPYGLVAFRHSHTAPSESSPDPIRAKVAPRQGAQAGIECARAAELPCELAQPLTVEVLADHEADSRDDVDGQRPPARAVEVDGDAAAPGLPEGGDDRHALRLLRGLFDLLGGRAAVLRREQTRGDDLLGADLRLQRAENPLADVRVLA